MNIRKLLFWVHLIVGCCAAVFIFLMSITGAALTYERQIIKMAEQADYPVVLAAPQKALPIANFVALAAQYATENTPEITIMRDNAAPILLKDGRKTIAYLHPFTAETMQQPGAPTKIFFSRLRAFHRWLTLDGKFSGSGRWVNGIANTIFVFLALSGLYLWLPKRLHYRAFKQKLTLGGHYPTKQVKHYQWHNVFGFYVMPALIVMAVTALFFSFKWPGQTLKHYTSTAMNALPMPVKLPEHDAAKVLSIDKQLAIIQQHFPDWQNIRFSLSDHPSNVQIFKIDSGNGGEPQKRVSVAQHTITGELIQQQSFSQLSDYRQARSYIRFLHTGEVFGLVGQTIAGIASLFACLLVYTGVMLSWRRWQNSRAK
ncbi:PepSY domain-containing protein [uncultured Paraglaciecola sp.]|uniref:PepSY-associated TM helix domain-containing protein n=1 Tax=uncultured Paraglaciecola sp. TaxID=1765024 RepID=UPI002607FA58|nr:PepSY-associated TM helix domain-containing protein [uncultured Paraglaciecola sp.]